VLKFRPTVGLINYIN